MRSRAAILHDVGGPWSVEEFELDPPRAGEVLVQMAAAGLCHSDDHILKGDMSAPNEVLRSLGLPTMFPMVGGHEGSGVVREIGYGVTDFAVGDQVVMTFVAVCGRCRWCATGMEYLCDNGIGTMIPGMPTDGTFRHHTAAGRPLGHLAKVGAFAEHTVVSTNSLVKIEPDLPLVPSALLSCAIPTGFGSAANRAGVRGGDVVRPWGGQWFGPQWPSGQVRFRCPWRVLPFIRWNLFGRKGYAGFKAFGVDREEYVQYMGAALVSVGSVALCPSFRLAAEDH